MVCLVGVGLEWMLLMLGSEEMGFSGVSGTGGDEWRRRCCVSGGSRGRQWRNLRPRSLLFAGLARSKRDGYVLRSLATLGTMRDDLARTEALTYRY